MVKKAAILIVTVLVVSTLWFAGAEVPYARLLGAASNATLFLIGSEARISVEQADADYVFMVNTVIDGRQARFPQRIQSLLYPTIMVLAWQIFLGFAGGWRRSVRSGKWNMGVFIAVQVIFLMLLTAYHSSGKAKFIYDMLMDSFYVIAVAIIIIDNIRDPSVFLGEPKKPDNLPGK